MYKFHHNPVTRHLCSEKLTVVSPEVNVGFHTWSANMKLSPRLVALNEWQLLNAKQRVMLNHSIINIRENMGSKAKLQTH